MDKFILDACCGGREMWFSKHHPNATYIDIRKAEKGHISFRPNQCVIPDELMDFREMRFPDKSFKLVVWDPPHLHSLTETSVMAKKYGVLNAQTWQWDLKQGFKECWRVLEDYGVLIFKWCEVEIPLKEVLKLFPVEPLFGHSTGSKERTKWLTFMKIPQDTPQSQADSEATTSLDSDPSGNITRGFQATDVAQIPAGTSESPIIVSGNGIAGNGNGCRKKDGE